VYRAVVLRPHFQLDELRCLCGWWPSCQFHAEVALNIHTQEAEASDAAVDYFLRFKGIEGEAEDKTHKSEIELASGPSGVQLRKPRGEREAAPGKVSMQDSTS